MPYPDALRYYQRVLACAGGYRSAQEFCRYFLFPGKEHGMDGMGTNVIWENANGGDELTTLRRWREEGKAPDTLTAVGYRGGKAENGIAFLREVAPLGQSEADFIQCPPVCADLYLIGKENEDDSI